MDAEFPPEPTAAERKMMERRKRERMMDEAANREYDKAMPSPERFKKGGSVRGDGIAKRGKTKGRMC